MAVNEDHLSGMDVKQKRSYSKSKQHFKKPSLMYHSSILLNFTAC